MRAMSSIHLLAIGAVVVALSGCGGPEPVRFRLNMEGKDRSQVEETHLKSLVNALTAAFGTPDRPYVFAESRLDLGKIQLAAGASMSEQSGTRQGLYRQHCAHCHGISGDGLGPTAAFLNPYPRDYRKGIFKFKSTGDGAKPTDADLRRTIVEGIPGTAMPSFSLLPDDEIDALVEYVKYLSLRGETEEILYSMIVNEEFDELTRDVVVNGAMLPIVEFWNPEVSQVVHPPARPETIGQIDSPTAESIAAGRKLFLDTKRAQCVNCHGPNGLGDGGDVLYDAWNDEKGKLIKLGQGEKIAQLFSLPAQQLKPRNLRAGIYRGGRRPVDLYRRIFAGIQGAQMPAGGASPAKPAGLNNEEIWNLVDYVRSLPYDERGRQGAPAEHTAHLQVN